MWSPHGVLNISDSPTWTPHGVYGDYWELVGNASMGFHGVLMESM